MTRSVNHVAWMKLLTEVMKSPQASDKFTASGQKHRLRIMQWREALAAVGNNCLPKNNIHTPVRLAIFRARSATGGGMSQADDKARVLEEWLRLPESRRRHATDAVAFAYRLVRERADLISQGDGASHDVIVGWLLPYLANLEAG
jgi:hypothetical protein